MSRPVPFAPCMAWSAGGGAVGDDILRELIKTLAPLDIDGDAFGRVYE